MSSFGTEKPKNIWVLFSTTDLDRMPVRVKQRLRKINPSRCLNSRFLVFFPFRMPSKNCKGFSLTLSAGLFVFPWFESIHVFLIFGKPRFNYAAANSPHK